MNYQAQSKQSDNQTLRIVANKRMNNQWYPQNNDILKINSLLHKLPILQSEY